MSFYTQLFGWEAEDTMPDGVEGTHYMCSLRGRDVAAIASRPNGAGRHRLDHVRLGR